MDKQYSVLMSVYYKEKPEYLMQAIDSMLNQTVKTNDFVLVCDGPLTQELDAVIQQANDREPELFHIIRLKENQGLGKALNIGLQACRNELVARMDSDDISLPSRCQTQLNEFEKYPDLALCSGSIAEFHESPEHITSVRQLPKTESEIRKFARKRNPMNHMAVMFRKRKVMEAGGYVELHLAEDYYLWVRMLMNGCHARNVDAVLVYARTGNGMIGRRGGFSYAKSICCLEKKFLDMGFISLPVFIQNCMIRIAVSLVPNQIRQVFYCKILRQGNLSETHVLRK